jgi:putative peptidoglycan lipid II flippase
MEPLPRRQLGREIGRAAILIGVLTAAARIVGFGRQLVFAHTVGSFCLGTAYATANQVPNIIYDIVLGGALTSAVVPVLAGAAARRTANTSPPPAGEAPADGPAAAKGPAAAEQDARAASADAEASQVASALVTWTLLLLVPAAVGIAVAAGPLASLLLAGTPRCPGAATAALSARMLAVFAPQIVLYGLAVVLYGILQAHRRFTAPALAPVISSLVVIAAYVAYVPLGRGHPLASLPRAAELMLSIGTTAGVAALALTALVPALRLRLRWRPALRFPPGVARRVRGLAVVGLAALIAQDAALVAVIVLANGHGGQGAIVLYNYGWQMFFVPYAILAVPIATSAFPILSAAAGPGFDQTAASSTRAVMLTSWLGAGLLAGAAVPAARLFVSANQAGELAVAFAAFAPGLVGYGLAASLSRVLFACQRSWAAGIAIVGGWLLVIAIDLAAVPQVAPGRVVPVLGLANTIGLTCASIALLIAVRAARGGAALRGSARSAGAGLAGAVVGAAAGAMVSAGLPVSGFLLNGAVVILACACAAVGFGLAVLLLDGADLRAVVARAAARVSR